MRIVAPEPKLPLLTRKDIRDAFHSQLPLFTQTVRECLKDSTYHIDVDFFAIYARAAGEAGSSIGSHAAAYLSSFVDYLTKYTEQGTYGEAVGTFNDVVTARRIVIAVDDTMSYYDGCSVKNGVFEINYKPDAFGTNASYSCQYMAQKIDEALFAASPYTLPLIAKRTIRDEWHAKREAVIQDIQAELLGAAVHLVADYDAIWRAIVDAKKEKHPVDIPAIAQGFGGYVHGYFSGFLFQIQYQFRKDELMVEGFTDAVPAGLVCLQVVPVKDMPSGYSECKVEDGRVVLRTNPLNWGVNSTYVAENLSKLL